MTRRILSLISCILLAIVTAGHASAKNDLVPGSIRASTLIVEPLQQEIFIDQSGAAEGAGALLGGIFGFFIGHAMKNSHMERNRELLSVYDDVIDWQAWNEEIVATLHESLETVPELHPATLHRATDLLQPDDVRAILARSGDSHSAKIGTVYYFNRRGREFVMTIEIRVAERSDRPGFHGTQYQRDFIFVSESLPESEARGRNRTELQKADYLAQWFADDAARLRAVMDEALETLSVVIRDDMNRQYREFVPGRVRLSAKYVVCRFNAYQEVGRTGYDRIIARNGSKKTTVIIPEYKEKKECKG